MSKSRIFSELSPTKKTRAPSSLYRFRLGDYTASYAERFGVAELRGRRSKQEDYVSIGKFSTTKLQHLTEPQIQEAIQYGFMGAQQHCGNIPHIGATVTMMMRFKNNIYSAWLGDGQLLVSPNKQESAAIAINSKQLHNVSEGKDKLYVLSEPNCFGRQYVDSINITHSIGDRAFEKAFTMDESNYMYLLHGRPLTEWGRFPTSVKHEPTLQVTAYIPNTTYLIACDGPREHLTDDQCHELLVKDQASSLEKRALTICETAHTNDPKQGSRDNLTVILASMSEEGDTAAVVDGHGGKRVARNLQKQFFNNVALGLQLITAALSEESKLELFRLKKMAMQDPSGPFAKLITALEEQIDIICDHENLKEDEPDLKKKTQAAKKIIEAITAETKIQIGDDGKNLSLDKDARKKSYENITHVLQAQQATLAMPRAKYKAIIDILLTIFLPPIGLYLFYRQKSKANTWGFFHHRTNSVCAAEASVKSARVLLL